MNAPEPDVTLTGSGDDGDPTSRLIVAATIQVDRLEKAVRRYTTFTVVLGVVCALIIAGGVVLGIVLNDVRQQAAENSATLQAVCQTGNAFRSNESLIWGEFLMIALQNNHNAAAHLAARELLTYVERVDKPRDCGVLTVVNPPSGRTP